MTQLRNIDAAALAHLNRALVGFDRVFNDRFFNGSQPSNYPPHNIVKYDENHYGIEVAVAGFTKEEITVSVDQDQLTITGKTTAESETKEYLHRGLAARDFEQTWTLAEFMNVVEAEVKDGMLKIKIERIVPEALKPRQIEIK
jgi:HSP20 family molecular chaperone IbpA